MQKFKTRRQVERDLQKGYREACRLYRKGYGPNDIDDLMKPFSRRIRKTKNRRVYKKAHKRRLLLLAAGFMWR